MSAHIHSRGRRDEYIVFDGDQGVQNCQETAALAGYEFSSRSSERKRYFTRCIPLHKAALKGDWEAAHKLISEDSSLIKAPITEGGETALHVAGLEGHESFVANLLDLDSMTVTELEMLNAAGCTALCLAATAGHLSIAKLMVDKYEQIRVDPNRSLPGIRGCINGVTPLFMAALQGHNEMAEYLYPLSDFDSWKEEDKISLLTTAIDSGLYGLAKQIVDQYNVLAVVEDSNGETPLQVLARKPLAFSCSNQQGPSFSTIFKTILCCKKFKTNNTSTSTYQAYGLLECLWKRTICQEDIENARLKDIAKIFFVAAESGNVDFLVELIRRYPDLIYKVNESKYSIFHIAVKHRYVKVFNLLYELRGVTELLLAYTDTKGNNILHLAAKLAPRKQLNTIPGAALQMQREVLWYKEVEKVVCPSYKNMRNRAGETPYYLFLTEHENLMKEGEKLMKQIAKACMVLTILIATVVFTTAFTVPGGYNNNTGAPILKNEKLFMVFPVSEAIATLSSFSSVLMFLAILTSRYSDIDFLHTLPFWLVVGIAALFISIVAMVLAFCTCLWFYQHALTIVFLFLFATVPIMFVILKFHLIVTMVRCTYNCRWLFRCENRLHT